MKKYRMLYMLHVSWFWIKQRPQFLAEEMARYFKVDVACLEDYTNQASFAKATSIPGLVFYPFSSFKKKIFGNFITSRLNFYFKRFRLSLLIKKNKIIWFTSPQQFLLCGKSLPKDKVVIYDCMDDHSEFYKDDTTRNRILALEKGLCKRADLIIASATLLKQRLQIRHEPACNIEVINNGIKNQFVYDSEIKLNEDLMDLLGNTEWINIVYIGTISAWFDFGGAITVLNRYSNCRLIVVGPNECTLVEHPQIVYVGKVKHDMVIPIMMNSDALIMPFIVTDLIKAVNPVKAYEYISSGKPVLLTKYEETICFDEYAYLYESPAELDWLFGELSHRKLAAKKSKDECITFYKKNTWEVRGKLVERYLNSCIKD